MKRRRHTTIDKRGIRVRLPENDADVDTLKPMLDEPPDAERWTLDSNRRWGFKAAGRCCWCQRPLGGSASYCNERHAKAHAVARSKRLSVVFLRSPSTAQERSDFAQALREAARKAKQRRTR